MAQVYNHYKQCSQELISSHGEKTVVLYQFGAFYEIYSWDLEDYKLYDRHDISKVTGLNIGKASNKKAHSDTNPYKMGFQKPFLSPYLSDLVENGYIVAIYDEQEIPGKKCKARVLSRIETPSLYIRDDKQSANYFMAIDLVTYNCKISKKEMQYAMTILVDIVHGTVKIYPIMDTNTDKKIIPELSRLIYTFYPQEIHVSGKLDIPNHFLCSKKGESQCARVKNITIEKIFKTSSYQKQFLEQIYGKNNICNEVVSKALPIFIHSIDYIFKTKPQILKTLSLPTISNDTRYCKLNGDSLVQLHVAELIKILDKCKTNMGSRLLSSQLYFPITDIDRLEKRYDQLEKFTREKRIVFTVLANIGDMEKRFKKLELGQLTPREFGLMDANFQATCTLFDEFLSSNLVSCFKVEKYITKFREFYDEYNNIFDIQQLCNTIDENIGSFFKPGQDKDLARLNRKIVELRSSIKNVAKSFPFDVTTVFNKKTGYSFKTTPKKFKSCPDFTVYLELKSRRYKIRKSDFRTRNLLTVIQLSCKHVDTVSDYISKYKNQMTKLMMTKYYETCQYLNKKYSKVWKKICKFIAQIDVLSCIANSSVNNGYIRPTLVAQDCGSIKAKNLRHPILEKITDSEYIPNDIEIERQGHLIYGENASGKSCFIRSVGISIIMAQAGFHVPASEYILSPYTDLYAKMSIHDSPFKNQSTFVVETENVISILANAGPKSMILADELFSSTETESAISLVVGTLLRLLDKGSSFIFTTHFQHIQYIPEIQQSNIKIFHINVNIQSEKIIYDRKILPGGIDTLYGIETASLLGMDEKMIEIAHRVRNSLACKPNRILSTKKSKYNKDIYMHTCFKCGSNKDLHTHHIVPQSKADKDTKLIDNRFHKNSKFNLLVLCSKCHDLIHRIE